MDALFAVDLREAWMRLRMRLNKHFTLNESTALRSPRRNRSRSRAANEDMKKRLRNCCSWYAWTRYANTGLYGDKAS